MSASQEPVVILGAGGRVGRALRRIWDTATHQHPVVFQSRHAAPRVDVVAPFDTDLASRLPHAPKVVVVLPGCTRGSHDAMLHENAALAITGMKIAQMIAAQSVVLLSSAAVYGRPSGANAIPETHPLRPLNSYGQAKVIMEQDAVAAKSGKPGTLPNLLILRMANMIGGDMLAASVATATTEKPVRLDQFEDGCFPCRSYIAPSTLARVLVASHGIASPSGVIFNLAEPGPAHGMNQILDAYSKLAAPVSWETCPAPDHALRCLALDVGALTKKLPPEFWEEHLQQPLGLISDWMKVEAAVE